MRIDLTGDSMADGVTAATPAMMWNELCTLRKQSERMVKIMEQMLEAQREQIRISQAMLEKGDALVQSGGSIVDEVRQSRGSITSLDQSMRTRGNS